VIKLWMFVEENKIISFEVNLDSRYRIRKPASLVNSIHKLCYDKK